MGFRLGRALVPRGFAARTAPMRITIVSPAYPPMPGGVSDHTQHLARALMAHKDTSAVSVVTSLTAGATPADPTVNVEAHHGDWGVRDMAQLTATVQTTRPHVVVLQYVPHLYHRRGMGIAVAPLVVALRRRGIPVVIAAHELYYGRHEGLRVLPAGLVQRAVLTTVLAAADGMVVTVSDRLRRLRALAPFWAQKLELVPVGSNLEALPPADARRWRTQQDVPGDALVLLFLGLAHPSKDLATLRRALDALQAAGIEARLIVVGGTRLDHPWARNLGYLDPAEAGAALAVAQLYLLPLADGASTRRGSLMNALAAGLPIISTRGGNTDQALFDGALVLVDAEDAEGFARATVGLAGDAERRRHLASAGRQLYEREFAWPVIAERWARVLSGVLDGSDDAGSGRGSDAHPTTNQNKDATA